MGSYVDKLETENYNLKSLINHQLHSYCNNIALECRVRYEVYTSDIKGNVYIIEAIDNNLHITIDDMFKFFHVNNENIEFFSSLFFCELEKNEEWKKAFSIFGKDFEHTKDILIDFFENH